MRAPSVDVIVVNYRTPRDLVRFTETFWKNARSGRSLEVDSSLTIVNVDPTEADRDACYKMNGITSLHQEGNIGYGRACNLGADYNSGFGFPDYFLFCNADVFWLENDALALMVAAMEENETWGVLGPRQVNEHGQLVHAGIFGTRAQPRHRGWKQQDQEQYSDIAPAVSVSGSAYMVRKQCWDEVAGCAIHQRFVAETFTRDLPSPRVEGYFGGFLPTPHYYEETWLSYHAIEHGWQVTYFGPACLGHSHMGSVKANNAESWVRATTHTSQAIFRKACDNHAIPHD